MVLGIYLIIIITAMIISKKVAGKVLKAVTVATNYVFILTVLTVLLVRQNYDAANFIIGFIRCAMASIEMIAFKDLPSVASTLIATTSIQSSLIFQMYVISFAASIMTAYAVVLALFGKLVRKAVLKFRSLINKKQYVLVGEPEIAATLLKDILNNDPKAFFIYVSDDNKIKDGLWLKEDLSFFDRMREGVEYHIMLIDSKNALSLTKIIDEKANGKKIFVTAVVDNDSIRFEDIKTKNIDAYLVSKEQLITHSIFKEMRPIDVAVKNDMFELSTGLPLLKRPIGVCVIGFGDFGKEYLLSTYENSQFKTVTGEKPFHALVIDEAMYYKEQAFYVDAPHFKDSGEIIFINTKAHTFDYFDAIVKDSRGIQQVLIATRDSEQNVDIALKLLRLYRLNGEKDVPEIIVRLSSPLLSGENILNEYKNVHIIHTYENFCSYEALVSRSFDTAAKERHDAYNKSSKKPVDWSALSTFSKSTNRAVVLDEPNKFKLIEIAGGINEENRKALVTFLAEYEHNRWNSFHYSRGWRNMPVSDLTAEERASFATKHASEKRHICLVPWEELDSLPQREPGILRYYDYQSIEQLLK